MSNLVTVIDFSSSGLRVVTGYYFKGTVYALQALEGEPLPVDEKGYLDKKETEDSLQLLLREAKNKLKDDLGVFIALLPPDGFLVKSEEGKSTTVDPSSRITQVDYQNCTNQINKKTKMEGKKIIYDDPSLFADDNKKNYDTFPVGSLSDQLEVFADAQMIDEDSYNHYASILRDLHLDIYLYLVASFCTISFINFFEVPSSYICLDIEKDYCYLSYVSKHRMNESKIIRYGIDQVVSRASRTLGLDEKKTLEYLNLFGLRKESGFVFITEEQKTLSDTSEAFKKAFDPLVASLKECVQIHSAGHDVPLILAGPGSDVEDIDNYFVNELKRDSMIFYNKAIGARNKVYANCLGAILISSFTYQTTIQEAKKKEGDTNFSNQSFSRDK